MKSFLFSRTAVLVVVASVPFFNGGCASYKVTVESIARTSRPQGELTSYCIGSGSPTVARDSLIFKEAAQHLKTALSAHGMWEATDEKSADLIIDLDYGMGPVHVDYEDIPVPVAPRPDRGGGSSRPTNDPSDANSPAPGGIANDEEANMLRWETDPVALREKHLTASCRVNKPAEEGRPPAQLWRVNVAIDDEGASLREYIPVLATAVMNQIGQTTDGLETTHLDKRDEAIGFVKRGM